MSKNWNDKSDFEVNKRIAELLGVNFKPPFRATMPDPMLLVEFDVGGDWRLDYCSNWADIGPLIEKYELKIDPRRTMDKLPYMVSFSDRIWACDKNPRRAAAICIIKLLESKQ